MADPIQTPRFLQTRAAGGQFQSTPRFASPQREQQLVEDVDDGANATDEWDSSASADGLRDSNHGLTAEAGDPSSSIESKAEDDSQHEHPSPDEEEDESDSVETNTPKRRKLSISPDGPSSHDDQALDATTSTDDDSAGPSSDDDLPSSAPAQHQQPVFHPAPRFMPAPEAGTPTAGPVPPPPAAISPADWRPGCRRGSRK
ncbi:hypothetical protein GQ602_005501 [Ophiocordyceps camponoti-floridani]|uniref:Uncharacterized protein n=1 Tax=Ophiocordyceps camponoti-floridani TaxID=2030778 RepID=A0A8H4VC53_9HYPO|nr:hypothetical protein GQ602_005501 [Ophiocordyceps camponoti-floridani]